VIVGIRVTSWLPCSGTSERPQISVTVHVMPPTACNNLQLEPCPASSFATNGRVGPLHLILVLQHVIAYHAGKRNIGGCLVHTVLRRESNPCKRQVLCSDYMTLRHLWLILRSRRDQLRSIVAAGVCTKRTSCCTSSRLVPNAEFAQSNVPTVEVVSAHHGPCLETTLL
jgi:hypothetical protein